jgi:hypothetical protein
VIGTAIVVLATLAGPEHEPGIVTGCRLARLHLHVVGVHRDLSRHSYSTHVGSKIIALRREVERSASCLSRRRTCLWNARFASRSYATGFRKSKLEDVLGMIGDSESG